jgi:hypothetical protein
MGLSSISIGTPLVRCVKSHDNGPKRLLRRAGLDERRDELLAAFEHPRVRPWGNLYVFQIIRWPASKFRFELVRGPARGPAVLARNEQRCAVELLQLDGFDRPLELLPVNFDLRFFCCPPAAVALLGKSITFAVVMPSSSCLNPHASLHNGGCCVSTSFKLIGWPTASRVAGFPVVNWHPFFVLASGLLHSSGRSLKYLIQHCAVLGLPRTPPALTAHAPYFF